MKNHRLHLLFVTALLFAVALFSTQVVWGQDATIPTRTPTPGSGGGSTPQPTNTPGNPQPTSTPDDGGGGNPPTNTPPPAATATNTPVPASTATNTPVPASTATNTPIPDGPEVIPTVPFPPSGSFPAAVACIDPPTITVRVETAVHTGPGEDYPIVEIDDEEVILEEGEIRPMLGRAQYAEWFFIQLDEDGNFGWVPDEDVDEQGDTNVPVIAAPPINGSTPTPGIPWNPTPQPGCLTATPTATATATATPTATPTATVDPDAATGDDADATATATPTIAPVGSSTDANGGQNSRATGADDPVQVAGDAAVPTAVPLEADQAASSSTPNFLPFVGLALVAAAVFIALFIRSRGSAE